MEHLFLKKATNTVINLLETVHNYRCYVSRRYTKTHQNFQMNIKIGVVSFRGPAKAPPTGFVTIHWYEVYPNKGTKQVISK